MKVVYPWSMVYHHYIGLFTYMPNEIEILTARTQGKS